MYSDQHLETLAMQAERAASSANTNPDWNDVGGFYGSAAFYCRGKGDWPLAASFFLKAADAYSRGKINVASANNFTLAAAMAENYSAADAAEYYKKAIDLFILVRHCRSAGSLHAKMGLLYEKEMADFEAAIEHYRAASTLFEMEKLAAPSIECLHRVAGLSARSDRHSEAAKVYEKIGEAVCDKSPHRANNYLFKAGLNYLAGGDARALRRALDHYVARNPSFSETAEFSLLRKIIPLVEERDCEGFTGAVRMYDSASPLDFEDVRVLLIVKNQIRGNS